MPIRRRPRFTSIDDLQDGAKVCIVLDGERGRLPCRALVAGAYGHGFDADSVEPEWSGGGWFKYEDEGSEWCRDWDSEAAYAFCASVVMAATAE